MSVRLFEKLFALPCNPFSYERGLLAVQRRAGRRPRPGRPGRRALVVRHCG